MHNHNDDTRFNSAKERKLEQRRFERQFKDQQRRVI